ncbi:MAG: 50S ribosomal protein L30 [Spirochaetaceae bacterium]|jgi:large subunit ribosomal protein L30|nr:50S ribosomal protein L30 [Spirochaetaceae bacterium]
MTDVTNGKIKIRLVRSAIGALPKQRATVRSLGLRKIGSVVEHEANGAVLGMVKKVSHLVKVENVI